MHRVIHNEICLGKIEQTSKAEYAAIMEHLVKTGTEGIILGCTEIGLLVHDEDSQVPFFATTLIHSVTAVEYSLES